MPIDYVAYILLEKLYNVTSDFLVLLISISSFGEFKYLMLSHKTG